MCAVTLTIACLLAVMAIAGLFAFHLNATQRVANLEGQLSYSSIALKTAMETASTTTAKLERELAVAKTSVETASTTIAKLERELAVAKGKLEPRHVRQTADTSINQPCVTHTDCTDGVTFCGERMCEEACLSTPLRPGEDITRNKARCKYSPIEQWFLFGACSGGSSILSEEESFVAEVAFRGSVEQHCGRWERQVTSLQRQVTSLQHQVTDHLVQLSRFVRVITAQHRYEPVTSVVRSDCEKCKVLAMDLSTNDALPTAAATYSMILATKTSIPFQFLFRTGAPGQDVFGDLLAAQGFWQGNVVRTFESILIPACNRGNASSLVVDIGGHMGWTSMLSASCGCRVVAFEPMSAQADIWKTNARINRFQNQVTLLNNAVSDAAMEVNMESKSGGVSSYIVKEGINGLPVQSVRLDQVLQQEQEILLLKIDVEGHEYPAWLSCQHYIKSQQVLNIVMEFNPSLIGLENSRDILTTAVKYGYSIFEVGHRTTWNGNAWVGSNEFVPWSRHRDFNTLDIWLDTLYSCTPDKKDSPW